MAEAHLAGQVGEAVAPAGDQHPQQGPRALGRFRGTLLTACCVRQRRVGHGGMA